VLVFGQSKKVIFLVARILVGEDLNMLFWIVDYAFVAQQVERTAVKYEQVRHLGKGLF